MHSHQREDSFVIQIRGSNNEAIYHHQASTTSVSSSSKLNFSAMKLFNRFRKILMRLLFSIPNSHHHHHHGSSGTSKQRSCDKFDPPKTSCSSYYSSQSHYSEAIADCIEFLNRSSQEGILDGRKSDVMV
ncbi:uncharacterized protein LOC8274651 [Ricinus communis]|uniref:Uncharacterized protein n=1 Tax=Ricinus communis TaxID=3988 RepID=B9R881_RICCO|nr:uncharacterized protein LOC8274651 [Ricinus communis]EEF52711.1 conserved hypothetical protein [Ricinus communis]|eukprot:XP_002510524.1 uncharacterized protein LOC8274651 [Ricinus communis]